VKVPANGGKQHRVGSGLDAPRGVSVDAAGNVFITDTGNKRVVKIPAGGGAQRVVLKGVSRLVGAVGVSKHS
jgi:hypothetical protein